MDSRQKNKDLAEQQLEKISFSDTIRMCKDNNMGILITKIEI